MHLYLQCITVLRIHDIYNSPYSLNFVSTRRVDGRLRIETKRLKYKTTTSLALVLSMQYNAKDTVKYTILDRT